MTDKFRIVFEVGADAPTNVLTSILDDLNVVTQSALDLAVREAESQAGKYVAGLVRGEGLGGLIREARRRELPGVLPEGDASIEQMEHLWYESNFFFLSSQRPLLWLYLIAGGSDYPSPAVQLVNRLLAHEIAEQLPNDSFHFRSVKYENPLAIEIISAGGAATVALTALLRVVRDWGPRRHQEQARAAEAMDQAWTRVQLRALLLRRIAQGELDLPPDAISDLISADNAQAIGRLSRLDPQIETPPTSE